MKWTAVVMAGGKGTRLYPISTEDKPKQFLPLLSNQSILQDSIDRMKLTFNPDSIFINSIDKYRGYVENEPYEALIEPQGKGTTFSVLYITLELMRRYGDCVISLVPSDHYIGDEKKYRQALEKACCLAQYSDSVVTIGVKPLYAEKEYGYINHDQGKVIEFTEKPDQETAMDFVKHGYLWNSGIFVFKASVMYNLFRRLQNGFRQGLQYAHSRGFLEEYYRNVSVEPKNFEKAIIEMCKDMQVIPADFEWSDIGSIDRLNRIAIIDNSNINNDIEGRAKRGKENETQQADD